MTDRQEIIINGVDVSGCDNFRDGYCCPGTGVSYKCDTNCQYACCVYKERLQRKTAECEELKEWCDTKDSLYQKMTDNFTTSYIEAKRYKQALDEIEDIIAKIDADECCYGDFDCKNCNSDGKCETAAKRTILDIIRKVKGEE